MNRYLRSLSSVLTGLLFAAAMSVLTSSAAAAAHVVIVVMDGARYSETWGDPTHANIPQIATNLAPQGVVLTSFYTDITSQNPPGATETNPGHATLACGTYQNIANDGTVLPYEPTLFQYYRQQKGTPGSSGWVVTSKDKLWILSDCSKPGWQHVYRPNYNCGVNGDGTGGYRADSVTHELARAALTNDHPAVMMINYKDPDSMGHANNWSGYLAAIRQVDGYAADLWAIIQADPVLKDTTTLFITNDHGRHTTDFRSHGDSCDGCRHLLCVIVGPAFRTNVLSGVRRTQPDIAVTAADLLGVSMPTATGQIMKELYQPPRLLVERLANNNSVMLSWPGSPAGFRLWENSDGQLGNWTEVPVTPQQVGSTLQVVLPATNDSAFYRLRE